MTQREFKLFLTACRYQAEEGLLGIKGMIEYIGTIIKFFTPMFAAISVFLSDPWVKLTLVWLIVFIFVVTT